MEELKKEIMMGEAIASAELAGVCIRCNGNGCPDCENVRWNIKE